MTTPSVGQAFVSCWLRPEGDPPISHLIDINRSAALI
jgi:hypothetical protein